MTASGEAATAAEAAMAAVANLATMQTNATAGGLAYEAHSAAGKAMAAYMLAKEASGAAAEAEDVTAAVEARIMAEEAMADAVKYATTATEKAGEAETAAMAELMIVGKTKRRARRSQSTKSSCHDYGRDRLLPNHQPMHTAPASVGRGLRPCRIRSQISLGFSGWCGSKCSPLASWLIQATTWPG